MLNKTLLNIWIKTHKAKIVRSSPGRLRIKIPGLNKVSEKHKGYEKDLSEVINYLEGISKIEVNFISSNVLILYKTEKIHEKAISSWINHIWKEVTTEALKNSEMPSEEIISQQLKAIKLRLKADASKFTSL
ncbi:MAG: HMA2 domain-containing protein [Bacteroidales bacterium]